MKQLAKLFISELKMTFREKQVWFWSIFYPVLLMVIFLSIFNSGDDDSTFSAKVAVVAEQQNEFTMPFTEALKNIQEIDWDGQPTDWTEAEALLKDKEIDAIIDIPDGSSSKTIQLVLHTEKQNSVTSQALMHIVNGLTTHMNYQVAGVQPEIMVETQYISSARESIRYSDFLLTGLIALAISQSGLFGMVVLVEMRRNGLLKRLKLTPVNMKLFGLSNIMVRIVLSIIQIVLLTALGVLLYNASLDINILSFLLIFLIGALCFSAMGYMIAALSKTMDGFFGMTNLVSFLMMFLSGVFFDYTMLPAWLRPIADFMPLTYFVNGIRDTMVYNIDITSSTIWINTGLLALWSVACILIGSVLFKKNKETR